MKFKSILIYCPYEGLFCRHVTTFVDYDSGRIAAQMDSYLTIEYDNCRGFLAESSTYNEQEFTVILEAGNGFDALIELAEKWGWIVKIWEGDCDD